jgi:isocitrate lyase
MIEASMCNPNRKSSFGCKCGHQDGKVLCLTKTFKINAIRLLFLELGVDEGVIVARTDSEGASLTQKLPSTEPGI